MKSDTESPRSQRMLEWLIRYLDIVFIISILPVFIYVFWASQDFRLGAKLFPMVISAVGIILIVFELVRRVLRIWPGTSSIASDSAPIAAVDVGLDAEQSSPQGFLRSLLMFLWLLAFYGLIYLFGLLWATAVFVPVFLIVQFNAPWAVGLLMGAGLVGLIYILHLTLLLRWPPGILIS